MMKNPIHTLSFIRPLTSNICRLFIAVSFFTLVFLIEPCFGQDGKEVPRVPANPFPVCTQFSPVPSGEGWKDESTTLTDPLMQGTIHEMIRHGFSVLSVSGLSGHGDKLEEVMKQVKYAASLGMKINYMAWSVIKI